MILLPTYIIVFLYCFAIDFICIYRIFLEFSRLFFNKL